MSNRAVKKLLKSKFEVKNEDDENFQNEECLVTQTRSTRNIFSELSLDDDDNDIEEEIEDNTYSAENSNHSHEKQQVNSNSNTKCKKSNKKRGRHRKENVAEQRIEEIVNSIESDEPIKAGLSLLEAGETEHTDTLSSGTHWSVLLKLDRRHLNPKNEMRRLFGNAVLSSSSAASNDRNGHAGETTNSASSGPSTCNSNSARSATQLRAGLLVDRDPYAHLHPPNLRGGGGGSGVGGYAPRPLSFKIIARDLPQNSTQSGIMRRFIAVPANENAAASDNWLNTQKALLSAMAGSDLEAIQQMVAADESHVNALLLLADAVTRHAEDAADPDVNAARPFIEQTLRIYERALAGAPPPGFSLLQQPPPRDTFEYDAAPLNRAFHIAIYAQLRHCTRKILWRSALELGKLLLRLDASDPLAIVLQLDTLCLHAHAYDTLIELHSARHWYSAHKHTQFLPNFVYSVALAQFFRSQNRVQCAQQQSTPPPQLAGRPDMTQSQQQQQQREAADASLFEALRKFPGVLHKLLERLQIDPGSRIRDAPQLRVPPPPPGCSSESSPLDQIERLYVARSHMFWGATDVVEWLSATTERFVTSSTTAAATTTTTSCSSEAERCAKMFVSAPRNVLRHLYLAGEPSVPLTAQQIRSNYPPRSAASSNSNANAALEDNTILPFDPFPPLSNANTNANSNADIEAQNFDPYAYLAEVTSQRNLRHFGLGEFSAAAYERIMREMESPSMNTLRNLLEALNPEYLMPPSMSALQQQQQQQNGENDADDDDRDDEHDDDAIERVD